MNREDPLQRAIKGIRRSPGGKKSSPVTTFFMEGTPGLCIQAASGSGRNEGIRLRVMHETF
jgi:hypothetical protein